MGVVVAPALGPVVGGYLTDRFGWPWIFYINVPFSILGMFLVSALVFDPPYLRRGVGKIDWVGISLLAVGLTGLQVVLERGDQYGWFGSRWIVVASLIAGLALVLLVVREFLARSPVVDIRLLRNIPLSVGSAMGLIFGVALFGTTFVLPEFTQTLLGYTAFDAGLVLLPRAMVLFVLNPVVGWLYNHVDARWLILFGSLVVFEGYRELAHLSLAAAFWNMVPAMVLLGAGMPFLFVPMTTVSVSTVPREDITSASALYTLARRVGGNIGYALVATLVDSRSQFHRARLGANISVLNPTFRQFDSSLIAILKERGVNAAQAPEKALGLIDRLLNKHATMLAYNDVSWLFGIIFLVAMPLVLLLPGRKRARRGPGMVH
jgi:DHA2 family multidrug resistance protein